MQERQVTVGGVRHELPKPFFVLATQNPIEQEGTYPLPEAQLDRFMFQIMIRYPTAAEEEEIVRRSAVRAAVTITPRSTRRHPPHAAVGAPMPVADHVIRYALRLVRATRVKEAPDPGVTRPRLVEDYLALGRGPAGERVPRPGGQGAGDAVGQTSASVEHVRARSPSRCCAIA
jgi:MoxR-like ATPase